MSTPPSSPCWALSCAHARWSRTSSELPTASHLRRELLCPWRRCCSLPPALLSSRADFTWHPCYSCTAPWLPAQLLPASTSPHWDPCSPSVRIPSRASCSNLKKNKGRFANPWLSWIVTAGTCSLGSILWEVQGSQCKIRFPSPYFKISGWRLKVHNNS